MALFVAINAKYVHTSLAVRYLRNAAGEERAKIFECSINDSITNVAESIFKSGEKHILFSCYLWNIEMVLKLCEILKKADENIITSLGGPEVSFSAEKVIKNKYVDHVCCGEGEAGIKEFVTNPPKTGIYDFGAVKNLNDLPCAYKEGELKNLSERLVYYETSRGCPYNCAFCLSSAAKGVRFRAVELVKKEISEFIKSGVRLVKLVDRTFNADNKRALEIVEYIKANSEKTSFHFEVKAESMSEELINSLAAAKKGLFQLEIGVQSTDSETLAKISRKENFKQLSYVVKRLSENNNIHLHLDLIVGLPDESMEKFIKSFNDVYALKPHDLQLGFLKKLWGAKITDADGEFSSFPPYEVIKTDKMSYADIIHLKGISGATERLYNSGAFEKTLTFLEKEYENAFLMFEDIANFYDFTQSISQKRIYELMYEFSFKKFFDDRLKNPLIYDFCLRNRDYLSFMQNDDEVKRKAFEFLKNDNAVLPLFPQLEGIKPTERYKKLRFEKIGENVFAFDSKNAVAFDVSEFFCI